MADEHQGQGKVGIRPTRPGERQMTILYQGPGSIIPKVIEAGNPLELICTGTYTRTRTNLEGIYKYTGSIGCFYCNDFLRGLRTYQIDMIIDAALKGILDVGRVYLSGAITGNDNALAEFQEAEDQLTQQGYETFNPMSLHGKYRTEKEYMRHDIRELAKCEFICFVNDISTSKGSSLEAQVAWACGIKELLV
jgi:hypothetical protein